MASSVYDLVVNVSTDIASLTTNFNSAADRVDQFAGKITKQFDSIGNAFKTLAGLSIAGFGLHAFDDFIEGAIEAQASLVDLATKAGTTAAQMSSLIPAAKLSGTSLDEVASASAKFSKSLIDVQAGTGKAADAFKALGLNSEDAARFLKDPAQGLLELGQHLNTFADDGNKTAAVIALLGRSGQDLLPFLKQLGDQTELVTRITNEQAEAAHHLEDQWRSLQLAGGDLKNQIASAIIPALSEMATAFLTARANGQGFFASLAFAGVDAEKIVPSITNLNSIIKELQKRRDEEVASQQAQTGIFALRWNESIDKDTESIARLTNNLKILQQIRDQNIFNSLRGTFTGDVRDNLANTSAFPQSKPSVPYDSGAAARLNQYTQALQNLQKQASEADLEVGDLFSGEKITNAERFLNSLQSQVDFWKNLTAAQRANLESLTAVAAAKERYLQHLKDEQAGTAALAAANQKYAEAVSAAQIAIANASATSQLLAISQEQDAIKRQYDRGLVNFQAYYDRQTELQRQAIDVQVRAEQTAVDALQAKFVDALNAVAALQVFDPTKFKTVQDFEAAQVNAQTKLTQVSAQLSTAQSKLNDTVQKGTQIGKDYVEQWNAAHSVIAANVQDINKQIEAQQFANQTIGLAASQVALLKAAELQEALAVEIAGQNRADQVKNLEDQIDAQKRLSDVLAKGEGIQQSIDLIKSLDQEAQSVFEDIFQNGHDAFQKLGDDIKKYLIDLIYQLTVKPIIVQLAAQVLGVNPAQAASAAGLGQNPILNLLGLNPSSRGLFNSFATSGFGQAIGLSAVPSSTAALAGFGGGTSAAFAPSPSLASDLLAPAATPTITDIATQGAAAAPELTGVGQFFQSALPYLPLIGLAIPLISSLFSKNPSPVQGQFQVSPGTTGFEDNAFTSSPFGNLGFLDANTQQFSGQAAQVFNKIVAGALDAFQSRFSADQSARLASILQNTTFSTQSGTFTTEDFLQKYGGQVLQQIVEAAFNVLDPALASVVTNFHGTADEVSTFANSLLGIYDATQKIGNADFTTKVEAALADATQATADKVLALVTIVAQFGDSITGLGKKIEALNPEQMTAFVDALGGAQQALTTMTFIQDNFTTAAQKASQTQAQLTADFAALGLAVPQDHAAFLALLDSIDVTTDAGAKLYASIAALAPEFVAVAGTADQAAQALAQAAQTGLTYFTQHFLTAQEQLTQRQNADSAALAQATASGTALNDALVALGYKIIPTTVDGVKQLVAATLAKYGADSQEYQQLLAIIPVLGDLIDSVGGFGTAAQQAATQVANATNVIVTSVGGIIQTAEGQAQTLLTQFSDLANSSTGDFGEKLSIQIGLIANAIKSADPSQFTSKTAFNAYVGTLKASSADLSTQLAEFNRLSVLYDASRAEQLVGLEVWRNQQDQIFKGMPDDLAVVDQLFQEKWDAIVNGVSDGVNGTLDQLQKFKDGIANYLKGLQIGNLSPLNPRQQLDQAQEAYIEELVKAQGGDQTALGDITQFADAYLKQAQSFFSAPSSQYVDIFNAVTGQLGNLAGTLPNGLPTSNTQTDVAGAAIAAVVPTNGRMVSDADIKALGELLVKTITQTTTDAAQANSDDINQQTTTITATQRRAAQTVPLK